MNRTVVDGTDVSTTGAVVIFRVKMSCITSVDDVINSGYGLHRQSPYWCGLVRGRTLTRRAQLVCDSPGSVQNETDYINNVFSKNNYNTDFVRRTTHWKQHTRSNAATARPLTLVKTAETLARNWPNANERHKKVTSTITLLKDETSNRVGLQPATSITYSTDY